MSECSHDQRTITVFAALDSYYAAYRIDVKAEHAALNNVVAWEASCCASCHDVVVSALIIKLYAPTLVRAQDLDGFIGLVGPTAQSDLKAQANNLMAKENQVRSEEVARRALSKRFVTPTR